MDSAKTSKEFEYHSEAGVEKLNSQAKSEYKEIQKDADKESDEEKVNFHRFFDQRVRNVEDDMLRKPELSKRDGPALTIDGKPVRPNTVWKREDMTPQQGRDLRATAERKVVQNHQDRLAEIQQTREDKQRALLDRELGPRRFDRDRSYREVGETERDSHDDYRHGGPAAGNSGVEHNDDELSLSDSGSLAPEIRDEAEFEWTPELTASFGEIKDRHEAERAQEHDHDFGHDH